MRRSYRHTWYYLELELVHSKKYELQAKWSLKCNLFKITFSNKDKFSIHYQNRFF